MQGFVCNMGNNQASIHFDYQKNQHNFIKIGFNSKLKS